MNHKADEDKTIRHHSTPRWLWMGSFSVIALVIVAVSLFVLAQPKEIAHEGLNACSQCHNRPNPDAQIFAAVNGKPLSPGQEIEMAPGDIFEVDFHFTGMVGDPKRYRGVGMSITLPRFAAWRLGAGTPVHPKEWSADAGDAASFWSGAWDRADNGAGPGYTRWLATQDRPDEHVLSAAGIPWNATSNTVVTDDRGKDSPSDRDAVANHMGADALVTIPSNTPPGSYNITVAGIGHDAKGNRASVSFEFVVKLDSAPTKAGGASASAAANANAPGMPMTSPIVKKLSGTELYSASCAGCHGARPKAQLSEFLKKSGPTVAAKVVAEGRRTMPPFSRSKGGPLSDAEIVDIIRYIQSIGTSSPTKKQSSAPDIKHSLSNRLNCLLCHGSDGVVPKPDTHGGYDNNGCTICHTAFGGGMAEAPHMIDYNAPCASCHTTGGSASPIPTSHGARSDRTCAGCHKPYGLDSRIGDDALAGAPPAITHSLRARKACMVCHDIANGLLPIPQTHSGRNEGSCLDCHKVRQLPESMPPSTTVPAQPGGETPESTSATLPTPTKALD